MVKNVNSLAPESAPMARAGIRADVYSKRICYAVIGAGPGR